MYEFCPTAFGRAGIHRILPPAFSLKYTNWCRKENYWDNAATVCRLRVLKRDQEF